jgi:Ca-activated chloride channel family protein
MRRSKAPSEAAMISATRALPFYLFIAALCLLPAKPAAQTPPARHQPSTVISPPRRLPPPALMVRQNNRSKPLKLTRVSIDARIVGHLAETTMTMTFQNPNASVMEGDLYFPLPEGSTISSYALDVDGQLRDGVVVDKHRARQIFEAEVRKGVDPGLVQWSKGNNFKTRVFPIPAKGTRTIRVGYVSEVSAVADGAVYRLPLSFRDKVSSLKLRVEVVKAAAKPLIKSGGPKGLSFGAWRDSFVAERTLKDATLQRDLAIVLPQTKRRPVRVEKAADGRYYFALRDQQIVAMATRPTPRPKRIGIYWDASRSRAQADHKTELSLLDRYLRSLGGAAVDAHLVIFRNVAERPRRYRLPAQRGALLSALRKVVYDGGTQLASAVPGRGMPSVDLNLLFSDGVSTFGREEPRALRAPVYAINGASTASHTFLRYLALRTGGAYFNLARMPVAKVVPALGAEVFSFISASVSGAKLERLYPRVRSAVHGSFALAGVLESDEATVTLNYGYGKTVTQTRRFKVRRADARPGSLLRRYWAQKQVTDLLVFPERNADAIKTLGKLHGIVTPGTSLLVLETLAQYAQYGVRPPASLTKLRKRYDLVQAKLAQSKKRTAASKLARVIELWRARVKWWSTRFRYPKNYRHHAPAAKKRGYAQGAVLGMLGRGGGGVGRALNGSAGVRAEAKQKGKGSGKHGGPSIRMKAWDPKTPYLAALKQARRGGHYAVYLRQRAKHGAAPAFYLDCAHYFRRLKRNKLALRILSNLAELELENPQLLRVLAHRLSQIGELDLSEQLFSRVRRLRPEEPQSYRDLALVLERRADRTIKRRKAGSRRRARADYTRALELLGKVVMSRWDRFAEIEVIALTELNNILPKARRLGARELPVDKRLLQQLTMDIRIVMSWDADNTDMDLHVIEPSGEHAFFSHNRTRIGGLVTRDFTRGYGPEVYAIRRAMRGKYKIRTKFYGSSSAKLAGAVTLTIDVYTNYGRRNQRRRSMVLRLTKRKETFTVGTIKF